MPLTEQSLINQYKRNLRAANLSESKDPAYSLAKLKKCASLLQEIEDLSPRLQDDYAILVRRIARLEAKIGISNLDLVEKPEKVEESEIVSEIGMKKEPEIKSETKPEAEPEVEFEVEHEVEPEVEPEVEFEVEHEVEPEVEPETELELGTKIATKIAQPFSQNELFAEIYKFSKISPLPDIVNDVYQALMDGNSLEYDDYLTFFESVNDLYPEPNPPLIYQESNIAFYIGDTHGAYSETINIISYLQKVLDTLKSQRIKIIFLGDYVDRNPNDLENLALIIAFWIKYPENVVLLRGNHEDYKINQYYGFLQNLTDTFVIEDWVKALYKEILAFFVRLPVIHVNALKKPLNGEVGEDNRDSGAIGTETTDNTIRVFAVHGGIPIDPLNSLEPVDLNQLVREIDSNVNTFEQFDPYMNWLLWADPREEVDEIILRPDIGRNQFGLKPFRRFMEKNHLHFMVRAHEVLKEGYKYFFGQQLISLFTASTYKNRPIGKAAFLRLESSKPPVLLSTDKDLLEMDLEYLISSCEKINEKVEI
ncbi:metallophosphoesterase family protein [Candidatus Harpocratesius sp.]